MEDIPTKKLSKSFYGKVLFCSSDFPQSFYQEGFGTRNGDSQMKLQMCNYNTGWRRADQVRAPPPPDSPPSEKGMTRAWVWHFSHQDHSLPVANCCAHTALHIFTAQCGTETDLETPAVSTEEIYSATSPTKLCFSL